MKPYRVYIAGPVTKGDQFANLRSAVMVAEEILKRGHYPFVPHLYGAWQMIQPHDYECWMKLCFEEVERSDIVLRMDGESPGADREVALAKDLGIPVAFGVSGFDAMIAQWEKEF